MKPRVCLAISSFRNDASVIRLLLQPAVLELFEHVFVVDSLGMGEIERVLVEHGLENRVTYHSSPENLGSAGNLALRLQLAADAGFDFAYALNHDGEVKEQAIRKLIEFAATRPRLGAAYPLRFLSHRGLYDLTGTSNAPRPLKGSPHPPREPEVPVSWSSSNGALYGLEPVRAGLRPWADLWMGWEDMGYGWLLKRNGYEQYIVTAAEVCDDYEYAKASIRGMQICEKPAWYAYYQARNLVLITRRNRRSPANYAIVAGRLAQEFVLTTLFRPNKRKRYGLLARGLRDGAIGCSGKKANVP